jgi:hypothetical protein
LWQGTGELVLQFDQGELGDMADRGSSGEQKEVEWLRRLSRHPAIAIPVVIVTVLTSINGILDLPQRASGLVRFFDPPVVPVHFDKLDRETMPRFGVTFSYPSDWDRLNAPVNGDGAVFVDPSDRAVTITGYGSFAPAVLGDGSLGDAIKEERSFILEMRDARIDAETGSGTFAINDKGFRQDVDGWRVVYHYIDDRGHPMAAMEKLAVADGREVVLLMKSPADMFPRYRAAFLQLASELVLTPCFDCASQN